MSIDLTTLLASAITSVVNGVAVFVTVRWLSKAMDKIEKKHKDEND